MVGSSGVWRGPEELEWLGDSTSDEGEVEHIVFGSVGNDSAATSSA